MKNKSILIIRILEKLENTKGEKQPQSHPLLDPLFQSFLFAHRASSSLSVLAPNASSCVSVFELMSLNSLSTLMGGGEPPQGLCLGQLTSAETCFDFCLVNVL